MKPAPLFFAAALIALAACDKAEPASSDHDETPAGEASFDVETGLTFSAPALATLQPATAVARTARGTPTLTLHARVVAVAPNIRASVHLPIVEADALTHADFGAAQLERIDRSESAATGFVDVILALAPATDAHLGEFVTLTAHLPPVDGVAVPTSAVLKTTAGTFVYVQHGDAWRRSLVDVVLIGDDALITSGLDAGATVLVSPVHVFWLTELRLTKGGGHSH